MPNEQLSSPSSQERELGLSPFERAQAMLAAFEDMSDEDIIAASRFIDRARKSSQGEESEYVDVFDSTLDALPQRDVDRGRRVFQQLASSPLDGDRNTAALSIRGLAQADHDYGMRLWDQLARDYIPEVRKYAVDPIERVLRSSSPESELAHFGLTLSDALHLRHSREQAEQGHNVHDPSRDAYERLAELVNAEQEAIRRGQAPLPEN